MDSSSPPACPAWCVADHAAEDEGGRVRHRSATTVVPGVVLASAAPHLPHAVDLLIEVHCDDGDPLVAVYIGDGVDGIDLTLETAGRLVRHLDEVVHATTGTP